MFGILWIFTAVCGASIQGGGGLDLQVLLYGFTNEKMGWGVRGAGPDLDRCYVDLRLSRV